MAPRAASKQVKSSLARSSLPQSRLGSAGLMLTSAAAKRTPRRQQRHGAGDLSPVKKIRGVKSVYAI